MSDELPKNWAIAPLSDLLTTLESGSRPRGGVRGIADGVPSIGGEHLNYTGGFNFDSVKYVPKDFAATMTKGRIQRQDILVVKDGATTGKTAFVDSQFPYDEAFVNEHVFICRPTKEIEPQFLFRFLTSMDGQKRILENFKGSAQGGINQAFAPNTEVPLAPLAEQQRIVAKLETLLGKVDASQQRLAKIPVLLKRFRQSVLAAACSGRLTADWREENPRESPPLPVESSKHPLPAITEGELLFESPATWRWCRLGSLAAFINGDRGKNYPNKNEYVPEGIPFINTGHIEPDGSLSSESMHHLTREKFDSLRGGKIQKGDLVYCLRGATLGKTALVEPYEEGAIASSLVIIRPREATDRKFLYYFLTSPSGKELVDRFDNGSAQPNLSAESVKNYVIALPPLPEQQEIVRRVEGLFALADQLEVRLAKARGQVDKLTPSLLARAFAGQLVPQNPTDEPAEKLLERIHEQSGSKSRRDVRK